MYRKKGNDNWRSKVLTDTGYLEMSWRTSDREIARAAEAMWKAIAKKREWDLLRPVIVGSLPVLTLYDRFKAVNGDIEALKAQSTVVNLSTRVAPFMESYNARDDVKEDSKDRTERHVKYLVAQLPVLLAEEMQDRDVPDSERPANALPTLTNVTPARLAKLLDRIKSLRAKPGKDLISSSTRRVVHSSWSVFFEWLRLQHPKLLPLNPMEGVKRPAPNKVLPRFHRLPVVFQIIEAAATEDLKDLFTFMYGTGAGEISVVLDVTPEHAHYEQDDNGELVLIFRIMGEKAEDRDRLCYVAEWARPRVEARLRRTESGQKLFAGRTRSWGAQAHLKITRALRLPEYPLYNCRHHWAVTWLEAGVPVAIVQEQLGHESADMTFNKYGRFKPKGADARRWEKCAVLPRLALQDALRRNASQN